MNMGACQFLRDFRRECQLTKSAELRKRVLQRQERNKEKSDSVSFQVLISLAVLQFVTQTNIISYLTYFLIDI